MLKQHPTIKKPVSIMKKRKSDISNIQNVRPISFNTKGYFSPQQPYNQDYLTTKQQVFKKYRDQSQELIVLDKSSILKGAFIQRGIMINNNGQHTQASTQPHGERAFNTFVKNYIDRKDRKQKLEDRKFTNGTLGLSQIRALQPILRDTHTCKTSRQSKSILHSRQSTVRSIVSYQDLQM